MSSEQKVQPARGLVVNEYAAIELRSLREGLEVSGGSDRASFDYVQPRDWGVTVFPQSSSAAFETISTMIEENFPSAAVVSKGDYGQIIIRTDTDEVEVLHHVGRASKERSELEGVVATERDLFDDGELMKASFVQSIFCELSSQGVESLSYEYKGRGGVSTSETVFKDRSGVKVKINDVPIPGTVFWRYEKDGMEDLSDPQPPLEYCTNELGQLYRNTRAEAPRIVEKFHLLQALDHVLWTLIEREHQKYEEGLGGGGEIKLDVKTRYYRHEKFDTVIAYEQIKAKARVLSVPMNRERPRG